MGALVFYLFYIINWIITLLPLEILYIFSDFLFVSLFYLIGYRKKIVETNLRNAFPEKSRDDIYTIEKKFYRHLADLFIETLKLTHMSQKQLMKRFVLKNPELLANLIAGKRDIVSVLGHFNNWEWITGIPLYTDYKCLAVYKPLKSRYFDKFLNDLRKKQGVVLTPMSLIIRDIISFRKEGCNIMSSFIADQTPAKGDIHYWTSFMNQDTPVYLGPEKIAVKYDMAVVFFNMQKIRRGYYEMTIELLFEHCTGLAEHAITEAHVSKLEEIIRDRPEFWIWSHRRWKYKHE
jgi:KDO2-lipid IV(A) lauroyltransferase